MHPNMAQENTEKWPFKFKHFIFDFDSTVVKIESFDFLYKLILKNHPEVESNKQKMLEKFETITNGGMSSNIPFSESLAKRMAIMLEMEPTKAHVEEAGRQIAELITDSFLANKEFFVKNKDEIYVISGGFREMILPATQKLGIRDDHVYANEFLYDENGNIKGIDTEETTSETGGKAKQLEMMKLSGPSVVIGDGGTDLEMKNAGGAEKFFMYLEHTGSDREKVLAGADEKVKSFDEILKHIQN